MSFSISAERLRTEVDQILAVISDVKQRLDGGVPGEELPSNDLNIEIFKLQLRGDLMLMSQRLSALTEVLE